jgi:hypothetical protein
LGGRAGIKGTIHFATRRVVFFENDKLIEVLKINKIIKLSRMGLF